MLDGGGAGQRRAPHALGRRGVHRHRAAAAARHAHDQVQLLLGEGGLPRAARTPAVVAVDLDPVGAAAHLVAHHARQLVHAARFLGAVREVEFRGAARRVAAARHDGARGGDDARSGDDALVHRVPQADVGVARALRAEVAHGCDAGEQRGPRRHHRARGAQRQRLVEDLIVPRRFVVGVQQQVRVALDESGHESQPAQLDHAGAGRTGDRCRGPGGADAVAVDDDFPAGLHALAVEHALGAQHEGGARLGRRRRGQRGQQQRDGAGRQDWAHGENLRAFAAPCYLLTVTCLRAALSYWRPRSVGRRRTNRVRAPKAAALSDVRCRDG